MDPEIFNCDDLEILIKNNLISGHEKFLAYKTSMFGCNSLVNINDYRYYEYLKLFSPDEIDEISKLSINQYYFFKFLPTFELIKKYLNTLMDDNNPRVLLQGISSNTNISSNERKDLFQIIFKHVSKH